MTAAPLKDGANRDEPTGTGLAGVVKEGERQEDDAVVVHGLRGRPSNRKLAPETRQQALAVLRQPEWHDFGPTFAAQQLGKQHGIHVGKETLRGWIE